MATRRSDFAAALESPRNCRSFALCGRDASAASHAWRIRCAEAISGKTCKLLSFAVQAYPREMHRYL